MSVELPAQAVTVRCDPGVPGSGVIPEWLALIRECNRHKPAIFGRPESQGPWWSGGYVEEYADARVILPANTRTEEEGALVVAKTDRGGDVIRTAAHALGLHVAGDPE
jgi:hypothetical protein